MRRQSEATSEGKCGARRRKKGTARLGLLPPPTVGSPMTLPAASAARRRSSRPRAVDRLGRVVAHLAAAPLSGAERVAELVITLMLAEDRDERGDALLKLERQLDRCTERG